MTKYLNYIFFAFLSVVILFLYSEVKKSTKENSTLIPAEQLTRELNNFAIQQEADLIRETSQFKSSNVEINTKVSLSSGYNDSLKIQLKEILNHNYKLFFYFSDINCTSCINQETKNIKKLSKSVGNEKIILVADYRNQRSLILFKRMNNIENVIYNKDFEKLGLEVENFNVPFYMLLNSNGIAQNVFVPDKIRPELSEKYLESVLPFLSK